MVSLKRKDKRHGRSTTWSPFLGGRLANALPHFHLPSVAAHPLSPIDTAGSWSIHSAATSLQGTQRTANEDRCFANNEAPMFMVIDGMGGYAGGAVASRFIRQRLPELLDQAIGMTDDAEEMQQSIFQAMDQVHNELGSIARRTPQLQRMGASLAMLFIVDDLAYISHVGDCRVYLCRGDSIRRVTQDQTLVQQLVDQRALTPGEASHHPLRHLVTNSLGVRPMKEMPSMYVERVRAADRFLLMTDGAHSELDILELRGLSNAESYPENLATEVVNTAIANGSGDDATCIAVFLDRTNSS